MHPATRNSTSVINRRGTHLPLLTCVQGNSPSLRGTATVDEGKGVQIGRVVFTGPLGTLVNGVPADYCMVRPHFSGACLFSPTGADINGILLILHFCLHDAFCHAYTCCCLFPLSSRGW
jgi:hypothetical protein